MSESEGALESVQGGACQLTAGEILRSAREASGVHIEALAVANAMFPDMRSQAVLDKLLITGLCALQWKPPRLWGNDRDQWKLPDEISKVLASADS